LLPAQRNPQNASMPKGSPPPSSGFLVEAAEHQLCSRGGQLDARGSVLAVPPQWL
jgi:hypothetical protein